jgi:hypothetical protein
MSLSKRKISVFQQMFTFFKCTLFHYFAHYAEFHYAECHYAECHNAEFHYAKCHYAECHYAKRRYHGKWSQESLSLRVVLRLILRRLLHSEKAQAKASLVLTKAQSYSNKAWGQCYKHYYGRNLGRNTWTTEFIQNNYKINLSREY